MTTLGSLFFCAVLVREGWIKAWRSYQYGSTTSSLVELPLFPAQVLIPIGAGLLFLTLVVFFVVNLQAGLAKGKSSKDAAENESNEERQTT
jgi:TRAP-type mannitol/chloroaromatic compound transport system permease small subunit